MATWAIILLVAYAVGIVIFLAAIINEAPKHGDSLRAIHIAVAVLWFPWLVWYFGAFIADMWKARKRSKV